MKLVVDVSKKDYHDFLLQYKAGVLDEKTPSHRAKMAIANGTFLPKCMDCQFGYCFLFEAKEGVENETNLHDRSN